MPGMDGLEATEQINKLINLEHAKNPTLGIPKYHSIVALTAYTSQEMQQKCKSLGMKKILPKPLDSKVMVRTL